MSLKLLKYLLSLLQTVPVSDEIQVVISLQYVKTLKPQTETSVKPISIMCAFANSKLIPILSIIMNHCNWRNILKRDWLNFLSSRFDVSKAIRIL